ncbi:MAG: acyltransferase domain-containing protein, partial [Desulfovibrio sp.]|nr:acyltransferase domain-containing protein [Desulfovibrio sp.]
MRSCITVPIAIIGVGLRLPGGVTDLTNLWSVLKDGRDCIGPIPKERWDVARFYHPNRTHNGTSVTLEAGLIEQIYYFDADFFGISPKEAESMDPQQRLLLELTWEALEDAGIVPSSLAGSDTAVVVGAASPDAGTIHADDLCATSPYSMTGTNLSIIANRISYIFNFHGPSFTLDTACSSSLYALHQACQILALDGAELAVAAGVNVLLAPYPFVGFSQAYMLSPEGRCKVFDAHGNGYVRSEGGGVLLLEPLDKALAKHRHIHAVIRAVACNSDGRTQGIALPSAEAQEKLLTDLYKSANCSPDSLAYLEAHGTGTVVGDPLEATAIGRALGCKRKKPLTIGSVKCNLGHLETASAMAGIMKSLAIFKERRVPRQIHVSELNPNIDFATLNLHVPLEEEALQGDFPLRIGVNSFGFGGANGHVLLEEAPKNEAQPKVQGLPPLFLSAKSEPSLAKLACQCAAYLSTHPHSLPYLANLLLRHRECLPYRLVAESSDLTQLKTALLAYGMEGKLGTQVVFGQAVENDRHNLGKTAFVFAGNGCHWLGMGRDLLAHPVFLAKVTEVSELFAELSGISLLDLLQNCSEQDLEKTENTQPLIFLIQVGLCAVLKSCGIVPDVVFGHSVGEVCAVWAAGILSLKDAVRVVFYRSLYQGKTRGLGKMAAAKLSLEELAELLASQKITDVELAGINAPNSLTLCGSEEGLCKVGQELAKRRLFFKLLPLDYAFHSQGMESIRQDLENSLQGLSPRPPQRIFISSVSNGSGTSALGRLTEDNFTADYWWLNIRRPVLFHAAAKEAISLGVRYFLEISPHAILQQYLRSALKAAGVQGWVSATMQRKSDNLHILQNFWKTAWLHGWPLEVENYVPKLPFMGSCGFPNYPWQKVTYRIAETPESQGYLGRSPVHPLLGWRKGQEQVFENELDLATKPWLADHKVGEAVFYPAAAYLEMSFACGRACYGNIPLELLNTAILRPVLLEEAQSMVLRTQLESSDGELRILGRPFMQDVPYVLYSKGRLRPSAAPLPPPFEFVQKPWLFGSEIEASELYAKTAMANMHYGPVFQAVVKVWRKGSSVLAKLATENYAELALPSERGMLIAPPLLDAGLQLIFLLLDEELLKIPAPRLPYWFDRCVLYQEGRPSFVTCSMERLSSRGLCCEIKYYDAKGGLLLALFGGRARTVARLGEKKATELYATSLVAMPSLLPSSVDLPWQQIIAKAEEALAKLKAKSTYQYTLGEERPLVLGALHSLFSSSLSKLLPSNLPKELLNYLQQQTFLDDLPDFPTLWQSLILGKPSRSSLALLLLGLEAKLNTSDKIPLQELWQAYVRRAYGFYEEVLLESLSPLLEQTDPDKPLVMILAYADQAGLALRLRPFWPKASLWLTATCEDKLETLEVKAKGTWSLAEERLHLLTWDPEQSVAKAPQAEVILTGNGLASANDLLGTLSHIYESLLPGGLFGFFETAPNLFDNVLRGLEPSFWVPAADGGPSVARLLTAEEWLKALKQVGFTDLTLLRPSVDEFQDETFIIFARRPTLTQSETLASLQNRPSNFRSFPQNLSKTPQNICLLAVQEDGHNPLQEKFRDFLRQNTATIFAYSFSTCCYGQEDVLELKASLLQAEPETLFILPLWAKDAANFADALASSTKLLTFARAYEEAKKPALRLAIVSFGAMATSSCGSETRSALSAALGVMRVMRNELPSLDLRFIDLDLLPSSDSFNALLLEVQNWSSEREVVLRGGKRYVLRSYPLAKPKATYESSLARLEIDD